MPNRAQYQEISFASINRYRDPAKLDRGEAYLIQNMLPDGGDLVTRPGFKGQFTTPLTAPVYIASEFRVAGGTTQIIFASGTKLYRTTAGGAGSATYTDITPAGVTINAPAIYGVRFGKYLYLCDSVNRLMVVTDTGAAATVVSLIAPTRTLQASLTSTTQDPTNNATVWNGHAAPSSTAELLTNPGFEDDGTGTYNPSTGTYTFPAYSATGTALGWRVVSGSPDSRDTTHDNQFTPYEGVKSLLLDVAGDVLAQNIPVASLPTLNETAYGLTNGVCRNYAFVCYLHDADQSGLSTVIVTAGFRDAAGNALAVDQQKVLTEPYDSSTSQWNRARCSINLNSLPDGVTPHHLFIQLSAGNQNQSGNMGLYVDASSLKAVDQGFNIGPRGTNTLYAVERNQDPVLATAVSSQWVRHGYSTAVNLAGSNNIAVGIALPPGTLTANNNKPRFRFGYTTAGSTSIYWTNTAAYSADGTYLTVDTSTVKGQGPGGSDPRAAATGFFIQIQDDLATYNGSEIFQFGPITAAGNLSVLNGVGFQYFYLFQEDSFNSINDQVYSSGSPQSATVTTTPLQAQIALVLPASTGANAPYFENPVGTVNRISIFRYGGLVNDRSSGYSDGRLIAFFDPTSDQSDPNGYWTWKASTRQFTDNTPDGVLQVGTDFYQDYRDSFPPGIQHITVHQNRLGATAGAGFFWSWLIGGEQVGERGLYTSYTLDDRDPQAIIKGFFDPLSSSSSDPDNALAIIPHGTAVSVYREQSITLVQGGDPRNIAVTDFLRYAGIGANAPRAVCLVGNDIIHRATSGLFIYGVVPLEGNRANRFSLRVDALIAPDVMNNGGNTAASGFVSPAAASASFSLYHSGRLLHGCPRAGSSVNDQVMVWDSRAPSEGNQGGFFQWLPPVPFTSGVSMSSLVDSDTAYFGGMDGQLYLLSGTFDQLTPTSPQLPIAFMFQSRYYGRGEGERGMTTKIPSQLYLDAQSGESMTLSIGVQSPDNATTLAARWTQTFAYTVGMPRQLQLRVASRSRGKTIQVVLGGQCVTQFRLREYLLDASEGNAG